MGHHYGHPLTGAMELRPIHWSTTLKSHLEISRNYALNTDQSYSINQVMFTIHNISCQPLQPILIHNQRLNPYQLIFFKQWIYICISYQYHVSLIPPISFESHVKFIPNPSSTIHESHHSCIIIYHMLLI